MEATTRRRSSAPNDSQTQFVRQFLGFLGITDVQFVYAEGLALGDQMMFENLAVMTPHIRKGSLRPLAVSSARRTPLMSEVPTVAETGMGLEGFEVLGWFALLAPAKTPSNVVQLLNTELNRMIAKPQIVAKFAELGAEPLGGTPERAAAFIRSDQEKWGRIIREAGIKLN